VYGHGGVLLLFLVQTEYEIICGRHWNVIISLGPKDGIEILVSGFVRTFLLSSERAAA